MPMLIWTYPGNLGTPDTYETYDMFSDSSTIVIEFSEPVQAGSGSITLTPQFSSQQYDLPINVSTTPMYDASRVQFLGRYVIIQPREGDLAPGDTYTIDIANRTVRGLTRRHGYAIDASLRPSWVATAAEYAPDLTARFSVVARLNFATIGTLPANDAGVTMDPISNVILALGGYEADGPSMVLGSTARRVDTYRDVSSRANLGPFSTCYEPCTGSTRTASLEIYRRGSVRGLRYQGKAWEGGGEELPFSVPGTVFPSGSQERDCGCPVCIYEPPEAGDPLRISGPPDDPRPHGAAVPEYPMQLQASGQIMPLECRVGPDGEGLDELVAGQGYDAHGAVYTCTLGDSSDETSLYYGIWNVNQSACVPLPCPAYPSTPHGNFSCESAQPGPIPSGETCNLTCLAGFVESVSEEPIESEAALNRTATNVTCDRGVYLGTPWCKRLTCQPGDVPFEYEYPLPCERGFQPSGPAPTCALDGGPDSVAFDGPVPTCVLRPCGATPEIPNGNVDGCVEKFFGDTCRTTCDDGYNVAGLAGGVLTCDDTATDLGEVGWRGDVSCDPVTCDGSDFAPENSAGVDCTRILVYNETCSRSCLAGYSPGGARGGLGQPIRFRCTLFKGGGGADAGTAGTGLVGLDGLCEPLACAPALEALPGLSVSDGGTVRRAELTGCGDSVELASGTTCGLTCPYGTVPEPLDIKYLYCRRGEYIGCSDAACENTFAAPTCAPLASGLTPAVTSKLSLAMPARTAELLESDPDTAKQTFEESLEKYFRLDGSVDTRVVVPEIRLIGRRLLERLGAASRQLQANRTAAVEFYVEGPGADATTASLRALASGDADALAGLTSDLNDGLQESFGPSARIYSVDVAEPKVKLVSRSAFGDTTAPPPAPGPAGELYDGGMFAFFSRWTVWMRVLAGIAVGAALSLIFCWAYRAAKRPEKPSARYAAPEPLPAPGVRWDRAFELAVVPDSEYEL